MYTQKMEGDVKIRCGYNPFSLWDEKGNYTEYLFPNGSVIREYESVIVEVRKNGEEIPLLVKDEEVYRSLKNILQEKKAINVKVNGIRIKASCGKTIDLLLTSLFF